MSDDIREFTFAVDCANSVDLSFYKTSPSWTFK